MIEILGVVSHACVQEMTIIENALVTLIQRQLLFFS